MQKDVILEHIWDVLGKNRRKDLDLLLVDVFVEPIFFY